MHSLPPQTAAESASSSRDRSAKHVEHMPRHRSIANRRSPIEPRPLHPITHEGVSNSAAPRATESATPGGPNPPTTRQIVRHTGSTESAARGDTADDGYPADCPVGGERGLPVGGPARSGAAYTILQKKNRATRFLAIVHHSKSQINTINAGDLEFFVDDLLGQVNYLMLTSLGGTPKVLVCAFNFILPPPKGGI